jgi:succinate dehydrogenase hydrophobic anchor subunit
MKIKDLPAILIKLSAIAGIMLVIYGYYLLSVSAETEFSEVMRRARNGMFFTVGGAALVMFYMIKRWV